MHSESTATVPVSLMPDSLSDRRQMKATKNLDLAHKFNPWLRNLSGSSRIMKNAQYPSRLTQARSRHPGIMI